MTAPVTRWAALVGACRDEADPAAALQLKAAEACCKARGLDPATLTNAQKATVGLLDVTEFLRSRVREAAAPAAHAATDSQLSAAAVADFPDRST